MTIKWTRAALGDVERLADFVSAYDPVLAGQVERELIDAPKALGTFPRRGRSLSEFRPREVRELSIGRYLMRYELAGTDIFVLRFFHGREDRSGGEP